MLPRPNRLARTRDFQKVFRERGSVQQKGIVLKCKQTGTGKTRFAIVVSKKVASSAVARNRIRRLISQAIQANLGIIKEGRDVVLVVLPGFAPISFAQTKEIVDWLLQKACIIKSQ